MITKPKINFLEEIQYNYETELRNYKITNAKIEDDIDIIDTCIFENVDFEGVKIGTITDAIFINCNLSNVNLENRSITRVEFESSRLIGLSFMKSNLKDCVFKECNCCYLNLVEAKIKSSKLLSCDLGEAYFQNTLINTTVFTKVSLQFAEISNSSFKDIDLSSCDLYGTKLDYFSIRGAVIDQSQAIDVVRLLNVRIKE